VSANSDRLVWLGEIAGVYGIKGWIKLHSYTEPRENLIDYRRWLLGTAASYREVDVEDARASGKHLIAKLEGVDDRDAARALIGTGIAVYRDELPPCSAGEYYWTDLEGLDVVTAAGVSLGRVQRLLATGAHDVLVLDHDGQRLIPFVPGETVRQVDIAAGRIEVDWDETYWE
jgi:16S rRNA processing protein RimM